MVNCCNIVNSRFRMGGKNAYKNLVARHQGTTIKLERIEFSLVVHIKRYDFIRAIRKPGRHEWVRIDILELNDLHLECEQDFPIELPANRVVTEGRAIRDQRN